MKKTVIAVLVLTVVALVGHCAENAFGKKNKTRRSASGADREQGQQNRNAEASGSEYAFGTRAIAANIKMVRVSGDSNISGFEMSETEITSDQFCIVMNLAKQTNGSLPVVNASLGDIVYFCNSLSMIEGLPECYSVDENGYINCNFSVNGYRLPTEDEWIYAFGGGRISKGYTYSGSDRADIVSWYKDNSFGTLHDVGKLKPNELGLYDMSGNASEICWPSTGYVFVAHGGNFSSSVGENLQPYSSVLLSSGFDWDSGKYGFRIVRTI